MSTDAIVRARIDSVTKKRAAAALDAMGLSLSDAIRLLMLRIADEKRLPFEIKVPTEETVASMKQLSEGKGKRFESAEALMKDLGL